MSHIFVSYASEDRDRILPVVRALAATGWSVFWDRTIPVGEMWQKIIGAEIEACRCMVVIWSATSINKEWVYEEASEGKRRGVLAPVLIDDIIPPIGFRCIQAAKLGGWDGKAASAEFDRLIKDIAHVLGTPPLKKEDRNQQAGLEEMEATRVREQVAAADKVTRAALLEFSGIRLFPPDQPQESKSWDEIGECKFHRDFGLDADPVFEVMVRNKCSDSVIAYRAGIRILQRIGGTGGGGCTGCSQTVEVQSEFKIQCPEEWKQTWGVINKTAWAEFRDPIEMKEGESPFRFTVMLENFSDPDSSSSCEVRFYLLTDKGAAESRSIWLSQ